MVNSNILLVGGGVTSSLIAFLLRNHATHVLDVWETHEELGGRMRTLLNECSSTNVDLGAQYVTINELRLSQYKTIYDSLISNNIITPLTCRIENLRAQSNDTHNYIATDGMSSLVKHFFAYSNVRNIRTSHPARCLRVQEDMIWAKSTDDIYEQFQAVVLTAPVPDILKIEGSFNECITAELLQELNEVKYSSRFVLVLFFDQILNLSWAASYMPHDEVFRYVAIQEKKVEVDSSHSSVVLHTSIEFGARYGNEKEAKPILEQHVQRAFPQWPVPTKMYCHKWNYSQVISPYKNSTASIILRTKPLILITGDGFTVSNLDGCIAAATSTVDTILDVLGNR
jgi:renalase